MNKENYIKNPTAFIQGFNLAKANKDIPIVDVIIEFNLMAKFKNPDFSISYTEGYDTCQNSDSTCMDAKKHCKVWLNWDSSEYKRIIKENK
jgi:hypothetical protein